jgi:hypothetical protein
MNVDFNALYAIQNFLQLVNDNWTVIIVIVALLISIGKKAKEFFSKSDDEKIAIAKKQVQETMLKLITDAEIDWQDYKKSGSVKRAQVIEEIFEKYPVLSKVTDQEALIAWIDETIDDALKTMREVFTENKTVESEVK